MAGAHCSEHLVSRNRPPRLGPQFRKIGRYSLLVFMILLLVLPQISPKADIVGRAVDPIVDTIARFVLGIFNIAI